MSGGRVLDVSEGYFESPAALVPGHPGYAPEGPGVGGGENDATVQHPAGSPIATGGFGVAEGVAEADALQSLDPELEGKAEELEGSADLLALFSDAVRERGLVGDPRPARLVYLALTSRLLEQPVSLALTGPSGAGKSVTVERTRDFFPGAAYHELTAMSERALIYDQEPLAHRTLIVFEAHGLGEDGDLAAYVIRSLLSEGRLRYQTVVSTAKGPEAKLIDRPGPTGLVTTTTAVALHPENATRLLAVPIADTPELTRQVFLELARDRVADELPDLEPWRELQRRLADGERRVSIPFAETLAREAPPRAVRLRRDFGKVLTLIRAHALLHRASRERDSQGRIVATLADYAAVHELMADLVADAVDAAVASTLRETVGVVSSLRSSSSEPLALEPIAEALGLDKSSTSRRVRAAVAAGYLVNEEDRRGRPARIVLGRELPAEDTGVLPSAEALREAMQHRNPVVSRENAEPLQRCSDFQGGPPPAIADPAIRRWVRGEQHAGRATRDDRAEILAMHRRARQEALA